MQTNAILAGLAVVLAIPTVTTICSEDQNFTEYDDVPRLFDGFTPDNVQAVSLQKRSSDEEEPAAVPDPANPAAEQGNAETLVLLRSGDGWVIGDGDLAGVPVRENKVQDDVLKHVREFRRDERALVKAGAADDELTERGLTEETGTLVRCFNAEQQPLAEFIVGADASGGEWGQDKVKGFFVRRAPQQKDIVLYEPNPPYWNLTLKPEDWIETRIQQFDSDKVVSFAVRNPKGAVSFKRPAPDGAPPSEEGAPLTRDWAAETTPEDRGAVRQQEVTGLLSRFAYVNVQRYVGHVQRLRDPQLAQSVPGPNRSQFEVTATLDDGSSFTMWVGEKVADKNEYYARFSGPDEQTKNYLVAVGDWIVTGFEKNPDNSLFDPAATTPPAPEGGDGEGEGAAAEAPAGGSGENG
ncbi:MAG: DUF4340 domain-containing protein [Planctomycetota bacterium]